VLGAKGKTTCRAMLSCAVLNARFKGQNTRRAIERLSRSTNTKKEIRWLLSIKFTMIMDDVSIIRFDFDLTRVALL
jgi:hypothetical protein